MKSNELILQPEISLLRQKNICVFQVSALNKKKNLGMVDLHNIFFVKIYYIEIAFFNTFYPIFQQILTKFCSQFTIKCLGSGQKPTDEPKKKALFSRSLREQKFSNANFRENSESFKKKC